jgi:signal transduction histidine kinase
MDALRLRRSDVVLTAAVVALAAATAAIEVEPGDRSFDLLAWLLVVAAGAAVALHRRAPAVMLGVTTTALAVYSLRDYPGGPVYLTWIGAIFALGLAWGPARTWLPAAASTVVVVATAFHDSTGVLASVTRDGLARGMFVTWAIGAVLLAGSVRGRRSERAVLEERARHLAETRDEEARRRVVEERVRIARDLHDSIAHTLASISVQAGVGAHVLAERPDDGLAALLTIRQTSGDALAELRSTLGMLRSSEAPPREPAAGLDRLSSLVQTSRAAGLPVEVVVEGEARPLPPAVDVAAFRIVQESLTNVIRHAGPARATVAVRHGDGFVEIEVTDDGRGVADHVGASRGPAANGSGGGDTAARAEDSGGGHGLAGMRERVTLLRGELRAGARPAGGYRVWARFPL